MDDLTRRVNRAAETILENERLTADLDDAAAQVLLDWGVACAQMIARHTAGLDDAEAEEVMYPRLRATRRLMRSVNDWVANRREMDLEGRADLLARIIKQSEIIYSQDFTAPDQVRSDTFVKQQSDFIDQPLQLITNLRQLLES